MYKHPIAWIQIRRNDNRMWNKTYQSKTYTTSIVEKYY